MKSAATYRTAAALCLRPQPLGYLFTGRVDDDSCGYLGAGDALYVITMREQLGRSDFESLYMRYMDCMSAPSAAAVRIPRYGTPASAEHLALSLLLMADIAEDEEL